jgi:5-oxoprolinase (ATP-hydrolysing)
MTNSRLTDPEILETRYPVLLEEFSVRANSGGVGKHTGGSGSKRRIKFLKAMSASILSNRRSIAPPGLAGGGDGLPGRNSLIKADGRVIDLGSTASIAVEAGDSILIETPGGGAYGA